MPSTYDIAVIGGGILGLATTLALTRTLPKLRVVVLEKEQEVAQHQSGRNSGVVHAGIYYRPGSLKAQLCVSGAREMLEYCEKNNLPLQRVGKLIVATEPAELPRLDTLYQRALTNGVVGVEMVGAEQLHEIEPGAAGLRAVYSPNTSITDYTLVAQTMRKQVEASSAEVRTGTRVIGIHNLADSVLLQTSQGEVNAHYLVNCAGLYSDVIARMSGADPQVRIVPFRGEYYHIRPDRGDLVHGLIYPVTDPRLPFLGVHFTRTVHGQVEAGPNAVLAFAREGYRRTSFVPREVVNTWTYPGFWRMGLRFWRVGVYEFYRSFSKRAFVRSLQRLLPEIGERDLVPGGAGVRAQAVTPKGELVDDFAIVESPRSLHILNAPSPAATASLALGRYIVDKASQAFRLS